MTELTMRCRCGRLALVASDVSVEVASRVVCYCAGCQAFARRMDPALLDERGGTERFQVSPACIRITSGQDELACLQQTPKGALRWYASCCDATLGLTLPSHRTPFVGLDVRRIDTTELVGSLDDVLGPVRARVNGKFERRQRRALRADFRSLLSMLSHLAPLTLRWWLRGDQRRSPFFDPTSGEPVVEVLRPPTERRLLSAGCR